MKKFSIKTLIVLMLVLVLCFSLVACGEKDNDNNNGGNDDGNTSCTRHVDRNPKDGKCDKCGADMPGQGEATVHNFICR